MILQTLLIVAALLILISLPLHNFYFSIICRRKGPLPQKVRPSQWPCVTCVIPASNEESIIRRKIENLRETYPSDLLSILVVINNSTDATQTICRGMGIATIGSAAGKQHALEAGRRAAKTELVLATDADVYLQPDTLKTLVTTIVNAPPDVCLISAFCAHSFPHNGKFSQQLNRYELKLGELSVLQSKKASAALIPGTCYLYKKGIFPEYPPDAVEDEISIAIEIIRHNYRAYTELEAFCYQYQPQEFWLQIAMLTRHAGRQIHTCLSNLDIIWRLKNRLFGLFIFPLFLFLPRCLPLVSILFLLLPLITPVRAIPLYSAGLLVYLLIAIFRPLAALQTAAIHFGWIYYFMLGKKGSAWHNLHREKELR